ncbi:MAG: hypothetical protein HDR00_04625 [Lachnospiraceae bacterium]|nr:hypothetical protein [Lachnospiraceae bacterium]
MADSGEVKVILGRKNTMIKKFIVVVIVCMSFCMVSCEQREEKEVKAARIPEKLWENAVETGKELINRDSLSKILNETVIEKKEEEGDEIASEAIAYKECLHKIWVLDRWSEENVELECYEEYSFYISEIKDNRVRGRVTRWGITNPGDSKLNFEGTIENGIGECQFDMGDGYKGNFYFEIRNRNELMVEFKYTYSDDTGEITEYEREGVFKPYNLSMIEEITVAKTVELDLDLWGTVWIAVGWFDTSTPHSFRYYGIAYLTNEDGDIFYEFSAPFRTGMWIVDAYLEDLNGDGLTDIKMIERMDEFPNIEDAVSFEAQEDDSEWHFLQREDGYFEDGLLIFG